MTPPPAEKKKKRSGMGGSAQQPRQIRWWLYMPMGMLLVALCWQLMQPLLDIFEVAPAAPTVDPYFIPTARPTQDPVNVVPEFWDDWQFLVGSEAAQLRTEDNVVNFALVGNNGLAHISADYSAVLSTGPVSNWQVAIKPANLITLTTEATVVTMELLGINYPVVLNIYQPFTFEADPFNLVYLVDEAGQLWSIQPDQVSWVSVDVAQDSLPIELAPNSQLSITIGSNR